MTFMRIIQPKGRHRGYTPEVTNWDGRRATLWSSRRESVARRVGDRVDALVEAKLNGDPPPIRLNAWLAALKERQFSRLVALELVDNRRREMSKPIAEHLTAFGQAVAARRNNTAIYAARQEASVRRVMTSLNVSIFEEISQHDVLVRVKEWGLHDSTRRGYLVAVCGFCKWMVRQKRAAMNPMECTPMPRIGVDEAIRRRPLSVTEVAALLSYLKTGGQTTYLRHEGVNWTGLDRRILYWLAISTGYRQAELASLKVCQLFLDEDPPTVDIAAKDAKNRTAGSVPIPGEVAEALAEYVKGKKQGDPVFILPRQRQSIVKLFRADLKGAGIDETNDAGERLDFHAMRTTAICWWLDVYGLSAKRVQILARLKTLSLVERYSRRLRLSSDVSWLDKAPTMQAQPKRRNA